jgi:hypothetical protein
MSTSNQGKNELNSAYLRRNGVPWLYHITHEANIPSIMELGIISTMDRERDGVPCKFISVKNSRDTDKACDLHKFARLAFTRNYPLGHRFSAQKRVVIAVDLEAADIKGVQFCPCNTLSKHYELFNTPECIAPFNFMDCTYEQAKSMDRLKVVFQAEVLVPSYIPVRMLCFDHLKDPENYVDHAVDPETDSKEAEEIEMDTQLTIEDNLVGNNTDKEGENASEHHADGNLNDVAETDVAENNIAENDIVENDIAENDIAENDIAENDIAENDIAENDVAENDIAENDIAENDAENDIEENDVAEIDIINAQTVADGVVPGGVNRDVGARDDTNTGEALANDEVILHAHLCKHLRRCRRFGNQIRDMVWQALKGEVETPGMIRKVTIKATSIRREREYVYKRLLGL